MTEHFSRGVGQHGAALRNPIEITVDQHDHGLLMMALAHLALERGDLAERAERVARDLRGWNMFMELRDLKMLRTKERRKQDAERTRRRTAATA